MNLFVTQTRVVEVPVQSISIAATCQQAMLVDAAGQCVGSTASMPAFMPTLLEIDLATGQIKNWNVPTVAQLQAIADGQSAAVAPTPPLTEQRMAGIVTTIKNQIPQIKEMIAASVSKSLEIDPIKPVEIDTFSPSEVMPDTVAVLEKYAPTLVEVDSGILTFGASLSIGTAPDVEPVAKTPSVDIGVSFNSAIGKWVADIENDTVGEHQATSTQGKFEAIKNVLKKAGLHGVYEINQRDSIDDVEFYSYDDSRTKDRTTVYVGGHEVAKGYTARTSTGQKYTAANQSQALDGLIANVLKVTLPDDAIVDTTDDVMLSAEKWRYSIDMSAAVPIVEPVAEAEPVAAEHAPVEPVADPDDVVPVCTLKQKLEPLPAITDNGELPSDFDGGDSADKIEVTVTKRVYPQSAPEYVARTGKASNYVRASSKFSVSNAIDNLLAKCKLAVARSAIVEITTDDDRAQNRTRYSIDTSFAEQPSDSDMASGDIELPESVAANPDQIDIEQAIAEALVRPELVMDLSQPAPVDIVTELDLRPFQVLNQLIAVQQRNCDPIYSAFFAARGITENGKLSSKGTRLLAGLSQAESNERGEQIIKNACEVSATDATYAEIVALINHSSTQMQALKLTDRISKHSNFAERQKLFFIQKDRIEALKAESAA